MKTIRFLVLTTSTLAYTAAFAQSVVPVQGPLVIPVEGSMMVNAGDGFHQVAGASQVGPGASVMVAPGGKGEIVYTDGCKVPVTPGSLASIAPVSPCAQGADFGVAPAAYGGYGGDCCGMAGWGIAGAVLGAAGLGVGIAALAWGHHQTPVNVSVANQLDPTITSTNTNTNTNSATGGTATATNTNANVAVAAQTQDQAQQQQQLQNQCQGQQNNNNVTNTSTGGTHATNFCVISP